VWSMRLPPHFGAVSRSGPAEQRHQPSSNHQTALVWLCALRPAMPRMTARIFIALSEPVLPWLATLTAHIVGSGR
jgi:hypothetical protein